MPNTDHVKCKMFSVKEVQEMLGLPKTTTYTFIKRVYEEQYPFAVVKSHSKAIGKKLFQ